jgi:hypothetical protein
MCEIPQRAGAAAAIMFLPRQHALTLKTRTQTDGAHAMHFNKLTGALAVSALALAMLGTTAVEAQSGRRCQKEWRDYQNALKAAKAGNGGMGYREFRDAYNECKARR